jgi:hypothetical protein
VSATLKTSWGPEDVEGFMDVIRVSIAHLEEIMDLGMYRDKAAIMEDLATYAKIAESESEGLAEAFLNLKHMQLGEGTFKGNKEVLELLEKEGKIYEKEKVKSDIIPPIV